MSLDDDYLRLVPLLTAAEGRLREILNELVSRIEDRRLVRAQLQKVRIKSLQSLIRKAKQKGWADNEALQKNADWVGGRVVCNNIPDVYRFIELLRERVKRIDEPPPEIQDYIRKPRESGYRGVHLNFFLEIPDLRPFHQQRVSVEVQVRTLLQDTWGELTHEDVYHQDIPLPADLRGRAKDLAAHLALADSTASEIRDRITALRSPPTKQPSLATTSEDGLAFAFSTVFGRQPKEYAVRIAMTAAQGEGLTSLADLPDLLRNEEYRDAISSAEQSQLGFAAVTPEDLLQYAPIALVRGIRKAATAARRRARTEKREIDRHWRSEMKTDLPKSYQEFREQLLDGNIEVGGFAEFFGASRECAICSTNLVDPDAFAEGVAQHYGVEEDPEIAAHVFHCGVETPAWDNSSLCTSHANALHRDD